MTLRTRLADLLAGVHPDEAVAELERLPVEGVAAYVAHQPAERAAELLRRMDPRFAGLVAERLEPATLARALDAMGLDVAARLVRRLDEPVRAAALAEIEPRRARALQGLLAFPENTAGALLDPAVLALAEDASAREARARIRHDPEHARYNLYVVDREGRLVGALNLRELLLARPSARLGQLMVREPKRIRADADRLAIVRHPGWREVHSLPVVDASDHYLGAIRYRTLRALEDQIRPGGPGGPGGHATRTADALAELFATGATGLLQAVSGGPDAGTRGGAR